MAGNLWFAFWFDSIINGEKIRVNVIGI